MSPRIRATVLPAVLATIALTISLPAAATAAVGSPELPAVPGGSADAEQRPRAGASTPTWSAASGTEAAAPQARQLAADAADATAPAAPTITLSELDTTFAHFTWSAADGGSPITSYVLRLSAGGQVIDEITWSESSVVITDLDPETAYEFSVAAVNAVGTGSFTAYAFTTPFDFVERQYGLNRFETAARVSYRAFPFAGIEAAFVANGFNFPDALAGAAAAGGIGGPVLLTEPRVLPAPTAGELNALAPNYVVVTGGTGSVSGPVAAQAASAATVDYFRLAGNNRFGTAEDVASLWEVADVVYLANGMDFPDALAGAAAAGASGAPVLLTERGALPAETRAALARLMPSKIVVLGGAASVSAAVAEQARLATGVTTTIQRLSGANRYDTAVAISKASFPEPGVPVVYVASGGNFADALAGAAAAGHRGGPMLLTEGTSAPASVLAELQRLDPGRVVVLGGPTLITETVMAQIENAAR